MRKCPRIGINQRVLLVPGKRAMEPNRFYQSDTIGQKLVVCPASDGQLLAVADIKRGGCLYAGGFFPQVPVDFRDTVFRFALLGDKQANIFFGGPIH